MILEEGFYGINGEFTLGERAADREDYVSAFSLRERL
jgi:hypothetical protein